MRNIIARHKSKRIRNRFDSHANDLHENARNFHAHPAPPIPIKSRWLPATAHLTPPPSLSLSLADRKCYAQRTQLIRIILIRFRRLASILKSLDKHITITSVCIPAVAALAMRPRSTGSYNLHSVGCRRSAHALNGRGDGGRTEGRARGATKEKPAGPS